MAKRATTAGRRSTSTASGRGNSNRTASRSNNSGVGRGRRPKSMDEYINEDTYTDDGGDADEFYQTLQQDAEEYGVEPQRVQRRASRGDRRIGNNFGSVNRGRGQNQYTRNNGDNSSYYSGGNYSRGANLGNRQDLISALRDLLDQFE